MLDAAIGSLNAAVTFVPAGTPCVPSGGSSPVTRGAVVSGAVLESKTTSTQ